MRSNYAFLLSKTLRCATTKRRRMTMTLTKNTKILRAEVAAHIRADALVSVMVVLLLLVVVQLRVFDSKNA